MRILYRFISSLHPKAFAAIGIGISTSATVIHHNGSQCYAEMPLKNINDSGCVYEWGIPLEESDATKARSVPSLVSPTTKSLGTCSRIVCAGHNAAIISNNGSLATFGRNTCGALGHDDDGTIQQPRVVETLSNVIVRDVALSNFHMAVVTASGNLFTSGRNWMGQLGLSSSSSEYSNVTKPQQVNSLKEFIVSAACGRNHTLALSRNGCVYGFGSNTSAQLGIVTSNNSVNTPTKIETLGDLRITQVAAGKSFSLFLTDDGNVLSVGHDQYGELGHGKTGYQRTPKLISAFSDEKVISICSGEFHSLALTEEGRVFSWGFGKDGQMGIGSTTNISRPTLVRGLEEKCIVSIACGEGHSAAITDEGELFIWGRGRSGQLGRGDQLESVASWRGSPQQCSFFVKRHLAVRSVGLGSNYSAVVAVTQEH